MLAPILLVVYPDESPQTITAISLAVVCVNAAAAWSFAYGRQRRIDYRSGLVFGLAGVPGAILGVFIVGLVPREPSTRSSLRCCSEWESGCCGQTPRVQDFRLR